MALALLVLGICNELINIGASISEGLGDWPDPISAADILTMVTGGNKPAALV